MRIQIDTVSENKKKCLIDIFDAFADLQYVLSGAILEFGGKDVFDEIFAEVHRSNMSKLCKTKEEVVSTYDYYYKEKGLTADQISYEEVRLNNEIYYHVFRTDDNKTLKNINYSKPDIAKFIK